MKFHSEMFTSDRSDLPITQPPKMNYREKARLDQILELVNSFHLETLSKLVDSPAQQDCEKTNNAKI